MLRGRKTAALALTLAGATAVVTACGSSGGGGGGGGGGGSSTSKLASDLPTVPQDTRVGKPGGTFRLSIVEPYYIDPYSAEDSEGQLVAKNIFDTLTTVSVDGKLTKLLAQSYTKNANCTQWTFELKPNQKFSNGETVDAESIKRGMIRGGQSDTSYHMANIVGFDQLQAGKSKDFTGVTTSGTTLKVALTKPDCEFDLKTAQPIFSPVPTEAGTSRNKTFNNKPIGNGPFMMAEPWQHEKSITLVKNPNYTDGPKPLLDKVEMFINDGSDSSFEYKGLQSGSLDYARLTLSTDVYSAMKTYYKPSDLANNGFLKYESWGINYLIPMTKTKPLDSVDARLAVSYAIDRDNIIKGPLKGIVKKATSFVSPPFAVQGTYQPGICASCLKQDPVKAKAYAMKAGLGAGTKITLAYNTGAGHEVWINPIAAELKQILGWDVNVVPEAFNKLQADQNAPGASGLYRSAWGADYPTAWNFLYPLLGTQPASNPGNNSGRYSNKQFDDLLAAGQAESDPAKRATDYKNAEKIAIGQDLANIPLWYRTQYRAFDSKKFVGVNNDFFENPTLATIGLR